MVDRLSPLDVSFLHLEGQTTPMHLGAVTILQPPPGSLFDSQRWAELVARRLDVLPRFRQKVRTVPAGLGNPVWVDAADFDLENHLHCCRLPQPGAPRQLRTLVARLMSRPLDRDRPLWEMHLVEGLTGNRVAVVAKIHHAVTDGRGAMALGALLLDPTPDCPAGEPRMWEPVAEPAPGNLLVDALRDLAGRPRAVAAALAGPSVGAGVRRSLDGALSVARVVLRPVPSSPLRPPAPTGVTPAAPERCYGTSRARLADFARVRAVHGGTVNDVALAVVAGALRGWLRVRGEATLAATSVRAMVPVSAPREHGRNAGNQVSAYFVSLPVGEPDPVTRLHQVAAQMQRVKDARQSAGGEALVALAGWTPPAVQALGVRLARSMSPRVFNLVVTNVPGPPAARFVAGAQVLSLYPVAPLVQGQAVCIGLTSYNGGVYFGINADRRAMPDVDAFARGLSDASTELAGACG